MFEPGRHQTQPVQIYSSWTVDTCGGWWPPTALTLKARRRHRAKTVLLKSHLVTLTAREDSQSAKAESQSGLFTNIRPTQMLFELTLLWLTAWQKNKQLAKRNHNSSSIPLVAAAETRNLLVLLFGDIFRIVSGLFFDKNYFDLIIKRAILRFHPDRTCGFVHFQLWDRPINTFRRPPNGGAEVIDWCVSSRVWAEDSSLSLLLCNQLPPANNKATACNNSDCKINSRCPSGELLLQSGIVSLK